jgi:hypothetical protein
MDDIVVRPSGIWNSRAPFNDYLIGRRRILRTYNALALAIHRLQTEAQDPAVHSRSTGKWLRVGNYTSKKAGVSWREYRRTLPRDSPDPDDLPTVHVTQFVEHLQDALYDLRRDALVAQAGLFETFTQSVALNLLLAKLEASTGWSQAERRLAMSFAPERDSDEVPSAPRIFQAMPELQTRVTAVPAFASRGAAETSDRTDSHTAFDATRFWRAVRNCIVHRGGIVNARFLKRHGGFAAAIFAKYPHMAPPEIGSGFKLYDDVVRAMAAVHYNAALAMNEYLVETSSERRGHLNAPAARTSIFKNDVQRSPNLLVEGDDPPSYRWTSDPLFRASVRASRARC